MSHLFKKNLRIYYNTFKIIIFFFILFLFVNGFNNYQGNKIIYLLFSIISNFLIYFSFRKDSIFFETFFGIFLWLGFWFKFTCTISFTDGLFREGVGLFNYSSTSFDKTLILSQIGMVAFILAGYFRQLFLFQYPKKITFFSKKNNFFTNNRIKIWTIFFVFFSFIAISNFYLKIYQKGLLPVYDFNFLFSGIYKWLLLFGLTTISTIIIFFEIRNFKKFFTISAIIIFFETFISAFSMLSRGMIFNAFAVLYGVYKFTKKINCKIEIKNYFKSILIIFILFYISVFSVNYIRANFFYVGKSAEFAKDKKENMIIEKKRKKYDTISKNNSEILYLLINRWVGIDGVMAVSSKEEILSKKFLLDSFRERPNIDGPTLYELKFNLEYLDDSRHLYSNVKGNTLPGIIAFLYYSGSSFFLFFGFFVLTILASSIEYFSFKMSGRNLIFSSLIGQIIAFRFIHFGYLPHQSYLLFGTIIVTIFMLYILKIYLKNKMIDE